MDIELLVVPDCPNQHEAVEVLNEALMMLGREDVRLTTVVIDSPLAAEARGFAGSPSFFINGRDVLPSRAAPAVACRMYRERGVLSGVPSRDALTEAIRVALGGRPVRHT